MTGQEQQMLQGLIDRVRNTQIPEKDPEAEQLLHSGLGSNPNSLYVLAQTVLVQQYALTRAQQQLAELRAQNEQLRQQAAEQPRHTSFLGSLLGHSDPHPQQPAPPPPPAGSGPGYTPVPSYPGAAPGSTPPSPYGQAGYGYAPPAGGGFLRSALQTATGVAAGALAFQGIEDLMHGFGHAAGYGAEFAPVQPGPHDEVINNHYGGANPAGSGSEHSASFLPDLNQDSNAGTSNDVWDTTPGNTSTGKPGDISNTSNASSAPTSQTADENSEMDATPFDDTSGSDPEQDQDNTASGADQGSFGDDSGSPDDSGTGFDDSSGGFDDSGGGS